MVQSAISSEYDIVIVGAGPGGCSALNSLDSSFKILMIDSQEFPRDKPCGGLLTKESKKHVAKMNLPDSIFSSPKFLDLQYVDFDNDIFFRQKKDFLNIDRKAFDFALWNNSRGKADFLTRTKLLDIHAKDNKHTLLMENEGKKIAITSKCIIGADGTLSVVRNKIAGGKINRYVALQEWLSRPKGIDSFNFIFSKDITDYYSWLIPKGDCLICGAAFPLGAGINMSFQLLKQKLKEKKGLKFDCLKQEAHLITKITSLDDIVLGDKNIFLVGEAAGLISPSTGDGISFAMRSGDNCARAINNNFGSSLETYEELCKPLVLEIRNALEKATILSDPFKRAEFLNAKAKEFA